MYSPSEIQIFIYKNWDTAQFLFTRKAFTYNILLFQENLKLRSKGNGSRTFYWDILEPLNSGNKQDLANSEQWWTGWTMNLKVFRFIFVWPLLTFINNIANSNAVSERT